MTERITRFGLSITLGAGLLAFVAVPAFSAPGSASKHESQAAETQTKTQKPGKDQESIGQKKFNQNCSRCHKAPQSFPPSISGTILKHMRVRASLSQQDERDILRFLNP
jgi:cytochrome c5